MKAELSPDTLEVMNSDSYRPAVSITMPFEPKINFKANIAHSLKIATDRIEDELKKNYTEETCRFMMQKIRAIMKGLNYDTLKKSIAIYVSPIFEKVLYLDISLGEKIIVDDSFDVRDLVINKKQEKEYLVLLLSSNQSVIYLARKNRLERKVFNSHPSDYSYTDQHKEKVANFTDSSSHKESLLEKFLMQTDSGLDDIIKEYHLPLFVMGNERVIGHFKAITKHAEHVVEYINGSYIDAGTDTIRKLLQQHIDNWDKIKQKHLLNRLEVAADKSKLVSGVHDVKREVTNQNGRLLVVEKDFVHHAKSTMHGDKHEDVKQKSAYLKDIVDEIIENVLENGGDVEFVNKEALKKYQHIALIKFH